MIDSVLINPVVMLLLLGATILAAMLRSGWSDSVLAVKRLFAGKAGEFDASAVKASLARYVQEIRTQGLIAAEPRRTGDAATDAAINTLARERSIDALIAHYNVSRNQRLAEGERAQDVFCGAGELASVMGLAGTLIALSGLANAAETTHFALAIGGAVSTTLYGLLIGNLIFMPLAGIVGRKAAREDEARQMVIDWLADQARRALHSKQGQGAANGHRRSDDAAGPVSHKASLRAA